MSDDTTQAAKRLAEMFERPGVTLTLHGIDVSATIHGLVARAEKAEAERDGANALIDRMHAQDVLAIQVWQKANPGNDLRWPGNIRLSAWCLGEIANLEAERDRMREALSRLIGAVDLANASLARGEGEQWIHSQLAPAAGAARASLDPAPLFGRWPGDESDEEIERLLKDF